MLGMAFLLTREMPCPTVARLALEYQTCVAGLKGLKAGAAVRWRSASRGTDQDFVQSRDHLDDRVTGDLVQVGDAGDQLADLRAEVALQLAEGDLGVLDHVVEDGGGQGGGVEVKVGEDVGDVERVLDELLAGEAFWSRWALAAVS